MVQYSWPCITASSNAWEIELREFSYTETDLNTNLSELAHEFLRELYLAGKKVSIYSASHPMAVKALGRPFILMDRILKFKEYVNLHISEGHLYILNIRVKPCVFTDQIMDHMQINDLSDILFHSFVSAENLSTFLERFVKRLPSGDYKNLMHAHLERNNVQSISVNSATGAELFESGLKYRADVLQDFSVRAVISTYIGTDFHQMAEILADEKLPHNEYRRKYRHDYYPQLVSLIVPEQIRRLNAETLLKYMTDKIGRSSNHPDSCRLLLNAVKYHHQSDFILNGLDELALSGKINREAFALVMPETSRMKLEASDEIERHLSDVFSGGIEIGQGEEFCERYNKLLRRGQAVKAQSVLSDLLAKLAGDNLDHRRRALLMLNLAVDYHDNHNYANLQKQLVDLIAEYLAYNDETFEFSDLIWKIAQNSLTRRNYDIFASLCTVLVKKREQVNGIWSYESIAVKKAVEELNRPEVINQLIRELLLGDINVFADIKTIMVTIGSEQMACALSDIISHESRQIRQHVLKIMPELGRASLAVFSRFMSEDANFDRPDDRRELQDDKWYRVRNAIFILGTLRDPAACRSLRLHIGDSDVRVRREIVSALEKIGGEEAADLLLLMANDPDSEIRESAIISIGLIGNEQIVPELIDLAKKINSEVTHILTSIGKLGGPDAKKFLSELLISPSLLSSLTSGKASKDELKLIAIKALGRMGDRESIDAVKKFKDSLSATQKLFGGAALKKAAEDVISRPPE